MTGDRKSENVVVTGGGGFLGKAVVSMLLERGDNVTSFSRNIYPELERLGVNQIQGDLSDADAVNSAFRGADVVFHVAARAGVSGSFSDYYRPNVVGTRNVVNACMKNRVKRLIYTSSPSVIFDGKDMEGVDESVPYPDNFHAPYPATKAAAEKIVLEMTSDSLRTVTLRPHLIWGPGDNHLLPGIVARAKRLRRVGDGKNRVDTIYIDNAAYAHLLAADRLKEDPTISGRVYFISQDQPVLLWDMVNDMLGAAGMPPVRKTISARSAENLGRIVETVFALLRVKKEPPMTRFMARELSTSHWFDISRAKKDLGYRPLVSTKEGLKRLKAALSF